MNTWMSLCFLCSWTRVFDSPPSQGKYMKIKCAKANIFFLHQTSSGPKKKQASGMLFLTLRLKGSSWPSKILLRCLQLLLSNNLFFPYYEINSRQLLNLTLNCYHFLSLKLSSSWPINFSCLFLNHETNWNRWLIIMVFTVTNFHTSEMVKSLLSVLLQYF